MKGCWRWWRRVSWYLDSVLATLGIITSFKCQRQEQRRAFPAKGTEWAKPGHSIEFPGRPSIYLGFKTRDPQKFKFKLQELTRRKPEFCLFGMQLLLVLVFQFPFQKHSTFLPPSLPPSLPSSLSQPHTQQTYKEGKFVAKLAFIIREIF